MALCFVVCAFGVDAISLQKSYDVAFEPLFIEALHLLLTAPINGKGYVPHLLLRQPTLHILFLTN
jgi:hypothetical protein